MKWTPEEISILSNKDLTFDELKELVPNHTIIAIKQACRTYNYPRNLVARKHGRELTARQITALMQGDFIQIINGHMLGDGSISKDGIRFSLSNSEGEYVEFSQSQLNNFSNRKASIQTDRRTVVQFGSSYSPRKKSYKAICSCKQIFEMLREKWYIESNELNKYQKIIPRDLELTKITCNRWYLDDGYIKTKPNRQQIELGLCTDDFLERDVDFLVQKLQEVDIQSHKQKRGTRKRDGLVKYHICIYGQNVMKFLAFIGDSPVACYSYKWDTGNYQKRRYACKQCSSIMEEWGFGEEPKKKFCSPKCSQIWFRQKHTDQNRQVSEKRECAICGKRFTVHSWSDSVSSNASRTCGNENCVAKFRTHRNRKPFCYNCSICGEKYIVYTTSKHRTNIAKTCGNPKCRKKYRNQLARTWRAKNRAKYNEYMKEYRVKSKH
jgi:hypothetical protein